MSTPTTITAHPGQQPDATTVPHTSMGRPIRSFTYRWKIAEHEDGATSYAILTVHAHHPDRKMFSASINRLTAEPRNGSAFSAEGYFPFDAVTIDREAAGPRYNAAAFAAYADKARTSLIALYDERPDVAAFFDPTLARSRA